jgi:hypothetical protein
MRGKLENGKHPRSYHPMMRDSWSLSCFARFKAVPSSAESSMYDRLLDILPDKGGEKLSEVSEIAESG